MTWDLMAACARKHMDLAEGWFAVIAKEPDAGNWQLLGVELDAEETLPDAVPRDVWSRIDNVYAGVNFDDPMDSDSEDNEREEKEPVLVLLGKWILGDEIFA